jgi:tetratricopeptide (TPR) repeat protein
VGALDGRRIGAVTPQGPRPLSWGLWSRFFERHLVAHAVHIDVLYRHSLGRSSEAEAIGDRLDARFGGLDLYPAATSLRTRGVANGDADLRLIDQAIRVTLRRPEIVPAVLWGWLERGQKYEPIARGMPAGAAWFERPRARVAAIDLRRRLDGIAHPLTAADLEALWREAPADFRVAEINMERRTPQERTAGQVRELFAARLDYDLRARRHLAATLTVPAERAPVEEGNCALDVEACFAFARTLVDAGRERDAVAAYEKALADPRMGRVAMSNNVQWLTAWYRDHGRIERALELANAAAEVYSARGLLARASLYESLDRFDEAADDYIAVAERYDEPQHPMAFFYRMARVRKVAAYEPRLEEWTHDVFPAGLQPIGPGDAKQAPAHAVQVMKDSELSRKFGIQAGDLIVGIDGWRVENVRQLYAVTAFSKDERIRYVLWRGTRLDTEARAPGRLLQVLLRSYPVQGWAE